MEKNKLLKYFQSLFMCHFFFLFSSNQEFNYLINKSESQNSREFEGNGWGLQLG